MILFRLAKLLIAFTAIYKLIFLLIYLFIFFLDDFLGLL